MDLAAADPAGEGRSDLAVAEVELGGADRRLVGRQAGLGLAHRAGHLVEGILGRPAAAAQGGVALLVGAGIVERGDIALGLCLDQVQGGLEVALVDAVEQVAARNVGAVGRAARRQVAADLGLQRDGPDRLGGADIVAGDRDRLAGHGDNRHRHDEGLLGRRRRPGGRRAQPRPVIVSDHAEQCCGRDAGDKSERRPRDRQDYLLLFASYSPGAGAMPRPPGTAVPADRPRRPSRRRSITA